MFEFLVETYASYEAPSAAARDVEGVSLAADRLSQTGTEVRLQRAISVPEDDVAFFLFGAASADAVRDAMTRAGLRFDAITEPVATATNPTPFPEEGQTNDIRRESDAAQRSHRQSRAQPTRSAERAHARYPPAERTDSNSTADRPPLRPLVNGPRRARALHMARAEPLENRGDR
jgi:hypothetical protein